MPRAFSSAAGNGWIYVLIAVWGMTIMGGAGYLWRYQLTPGPVAGAAPQVWRDDSVIPGHPGRPLLIMIAHPKCACTRASVHELGRLAARFAGLQTPPLIYLSIVVPEGAGAGWEDGPVLKSAAAIPGLQVVFDPGGRFAARFGATTSGHVLLYGADDALIFNGGITAARAHEGYATGQEAIFAALYGKTPKTRVAPVFGCGLETPAARS